MSNKDKIVAYRIDGSPVTLQEYKMAIYKADKQIENGDFISAEDLEKEVRNW